MRLREKTAVLALVPGLALFGLSACGSSQAAHTAVTSSRPPTSRPRHTRPALPGIGVPQRVRAAATTLVVTPTAVIDPLQRSGAQVPPGMKAVGVQVSVHNVGSGSYDSSATGDFTLFSSGGPGSPVFVPSGRCQTPLQDFMNAISPGELRTGCIAFALPTAQPPTTFRFVPKGGGGQSRSWVVR